jgi:hypothetical protein
MTKFAVQHWEKQTRFTFSVTSVDFLGFHHHFKKFTAFNFSIIETPRDKNPKGLEDWKGGLESLFQIIIIITFQVDVFIFRSKRIDFLSLAVFCFLMRKTLWKMKN